MKISSLVNDFRVLGCVLAGLALVSCSDSVELPQEVVAVQDKLPERVDYNLHVKPVLPDWCFKCHGPDKNKIGAGLQLANFDGATQILKSGTVAIAPGDIVNSELIKRILSHNPDEVMPTPKSNLALSDEEKAILIKWVEQGAQYMEHWSLSPIEKPDVPNIADRTNTFGKAMLGLTMECCRCHDHKYDPISAKDYYSLFAFFNQSKETGQITHNGEA